MLRQQAKRRSSSFAIHLYKVNSHFVAVICVKQSAISFEKVIQFEVDVSVRGYASGKAAVKIE